MRATLGAAVRLNCNKAERALVRDFLSEPSFIYAIAQKTKKGRYKKVDGKYVPAKQKISYFLERKETDGTWTIYIPSGALSLLEKKIDQLVITKKVNAPAEDIKFLPEKKKELQLRAFQTEALVASKKEDQGIFLVPTGGGKTILGLCLIAQKKTKTLIICDSTQIFNQWIASIEEMFGFYPGIVKAKKIDLEPPIVVAMSQTMINHSEMKASSKIFGLLIVDECQQIGPGSFYSNDSPIFNGMGTITQWFSSRYKYGLSDSALRSDKQNCAPIFALGDIIYEVDYNQLERDNCVIKPELIIRQTEFVCKYQSGDYLKLVPELIADEVRNLLIIKDLIAEQNESCLILANSRKYVRMLAGMLIEHQPELNSRIVVLTSSTPQKERWAAIEKMKDKKINFLFCTSLADKGMDIPILNRLFMVFPGKFEGQKRQQLGRVVRFQDAKEAKVYDYVDYQTPILMVQFLNRFKEVYLHRCIPDFTDSFVENLCKGRLKKYLSKQRTMALNFTV